MSLVLIGSFLDERGNVVVLSDGETDYLLIYTKKGYLRGGELHGGEQYNVLLKGEVRWFIDEQLPVKQLEPFQTIGKETPHMMESLTDSVMLEWREYPIEKPVNYYKPYRKQILERIEELK